ncbi:hypothetical protein OPIT5_13165 [Opitutaceae bacterium TAV5]|nr:hypothetical protein OPIT5_13165 [Opitutaceae bacterium TAV5]
MKPTLTYPFTGAARAVICLAFAVSAQALVAQTVLVQSAVAWWSFDGATTGTNGRNLTAVSTSTSGLTPVVDVDYVTVSGLPGLATGSQAVKFNGSTVLKTNDPALRIGGAQTFWLRVSLGDVSGTITLMSRSRANNGQRGISLQLANGRLVAYVSSDGQAYEAQLSDSQSTALSANTWYDISLRFDPSKSLRIDLYDPTTGSLLDTLETTSGIPASISTTNSIGAGYFQIGGINNGSSGSAWAVPAGTLIEAAGVWNRVLTNEEIMSLSAIPEPAAASLVAGLCVLAGCLALRRRHTH